MTRSQHEATRARREAEAAWLKTYGWVQEAPAVGNRWAHPNAPKARESYAQKDALNMTDAEPLRYGGPR